MVEDQKFKKGMLGYNKDKREQVESPHTILGVLHSQSGVMVVLEPQTPSDSLVLEPAEKVEVISSSGLDNKVKFSLISPELNI